MPSLLRKRGHRAEVTSVELFFDLVFVIGVTQISHALLEHLTWLGALEAAILLVAMWWAWIDTAWITNWLDPQKAPVRLMLFALMGIGLVMTSSLPEAFGDRGLAFAIAFVTFQLGRTIFMMWAVRREPVIFNNFIRIIIWYAASSVIWVLGGFLGGEARLWCWLVAVGLDTISAAIAFWVPGLGRSDTREWTIDGALIAERAGLFIMIALGESVLATGLGFTHLEWTFEVILGMAVSLLMAIAMWSIYFGGHAERASARIARAEDPGALGRSAYTYVPILLVAGIIVSAVGDELVLEHPTGHVETATALVLIGGPLLFLLGAMLFKLAAFQVWWGPRLVGIIALAALYPFAAGMTPVILSTLTTAVMLAVGIYELVWMVRHPDDTPVSDEIRIEN